MLTFASTANVVRCTIAMAQAACSNRPSGRWRGTGSPQRAFPRVQLGADLGD